MIFEPRTAGTRARAASPATPRAAARGAASSGDVASPSGDTISIARLNVHVYVCVCNYVYIYIYVCMCVYIYIYIYITTCSAARRGAWFAAMSCPAVGVAREPLW